VFHLTILWLTDFRLRDLGAITKHMQTKKVSEPTFLHQIKRCFGILFGLSAQVNMALIFEINTNLNENHKEMS
jgi:flagellin-specific chaperone FliS